MPNQNMTHTSPVFHARAAGKLPLHCYSTTSPPVTTTTLPATIRSCSGRSRTTRARRTRTSTTSSGSTLGRVKCLPSFLPSFPLFAPLCVITRLYEGESGERREAMPMRADSELTWDHSSSSSSSSDGGGGDGGGGLANPFSLPLSFPLCILRALLSPRSARPAWSPTVCPPPSLSGGGERGAGALTYVHKNARPPELLRPPQRQKQGTDRWRGERRRQLLAAAAAK